MSGTDYDAMLEELSRNTFRYFEREVNPTNGLVKDNTRTDSPASIAGSGMALACYVVAAERGYLSRADAVDHALTILRFFSDAPQSSAPNATGYRGFFYHFLDMETGRRAWRSELSTIDSALLFAGALVAAGYFDRDTAGERELRALADALYRRADWRWVLADDHVVSHGWRPERGFIPYGWGGYSEALFLYVLGLGSPTHPLPSASYRAWTGTYKWKTIYGHDFLYAGPFFIHQMSHLWIDFRGIRDRFMRSKEIDYFENSRRATHIQREYAIRNPRDFVGYDQHCWGITASDGPGRERCEVKGCERRFYGYRARGVPWGADDGTLAPWAVVASLPFAPEVVLPSLEHLDERHPDLSTDEGYRCSFNPSFCGDGGRSSAWISEGHYALNQGPVILMIENYRTGLIWQLMRRSPYVVRGLRRAEFRGGWLGS